MKPMTTAILMLLVGGSAWADSGPIVKVTGGQIKGAALDKGGAVFKGIPYAQPPVGDLRWREPMRVKPWTGVRDATAFGAICPQAPPFVGNGVASGEDCLYLNVWTPEWPSRSRKAVMVWIPGGGNIFGGVIAGNPNNDGNDGESLARHGVVVVSLNYRLGSFGFFAHPALTRESPHHASGNQGILDQIAALKWVRDNIATFGGDPRNVTIAGESAGSIDASFLMATPLSKGLFERVIGESGSVIIGQGTFQALGEAEKSGDNLAAGWRVPPDASLKVLRAISAADILKADSDIGSVIQDPLGRVHIPQAVVDGYVFLESPIKTFTQGKEHRVALLHGSNSGDGVVLAQGLNLSGAINEAYGSLAEQARKLYTGDADPVYGPPANQWIADTEFRCAAVTQLIWHALAGNPSYQYEFARSLPGLIAGAFHSMDLYYVFGTLERGIQGPPGSPGLRPTNAVDKQISDAMQQYWTNFAKSGDPNGGGLPVWPKFDPTSRAYIQFTDAGPIAKEGLRRPQCDLFIENVKRLAAK
jgi:para-nitrobenzyl esterase